MGIQRVKQGMVKDLESKLTDIESTSGGVNGITSVNDKIGIGTTSPEHDLHVKDYSAQICVEGTGSDYAEGVFVSKNKGGASRGGGLAMKSTDSADNNHVEWYVGRPYAGNDRLIIARQTGDSTQGRSITQTSRALVTVQNNGVIIAGGFQNSSDERLKENITVVEDAVESLKKIRGVSFTWKENVDSRKRREGKMFGVLAQEVLEIDPEMCELQEAVSEGDEKFYTFDYSNLTPYFIEAIKEQQATIESQQAKIDNLEARISALENS